MYLSRFCLIIAFVCCLSISKADSYTLMFTPKDQPFNFSLGPQGQVYLEAWSCRDLESLRDSFRDWKQSKGEELGQSPDCLCGARNLPIDVNVHFREKIKDKNSSRRLPGLNARLDMRYRCFLDLTNEMPERVLDLSRQQLLKDEVSSLMNQIFQYEGVNCYSTALFTNGLIDSNRFVSQHEFSLFVNSPYCKSIPISELRPGDFILFLDPNSPREKINHVATYIDPYLVFEKKGGHRDFPIQVANNEDTTRLNGNNKKYVRCDENNKFFSDKDTIEIQQKIKSLEACLENLFYMGVSAMPSNFNSFIIDSIAPIIELAQDKMSSCMDEDLRVTQDQTLEYEYWNLMLIRARSIEQQIIRPPQWPSPYSVRELL